ncbi:lysosome membrane protein 2 [Tetranychus urticae]|uniref:Scavenger receptor class B member 1 n=1 Tax=Tetranychus urticae TaxID=32264 RepID=T1KEV9_TETUR|nr:lysosome membrane protein 2 [Tetranychus urticae]
MDLNKSMSPITLIIGLSIIVFGIYLPILIDNFITTTIQQKFPLTNGSETLSAWTNPDIPIYTRFYLFNLTNVDDFISGEKAIFTEMGPYTFRQVRRNVIHTWNSDETLFDYETIRSYNFVPHLSAGNLDDTLTLINFPVVTIAKTIAEKAPMFKKTAGSIIKKHGGGLFLNLTVGQVLFDGFEVPFVTKLSTISRSLKMPIPDKFGIMYGQNNSGNGVYTAFTGKDDVKKLLLMHEWRGERTVDCWASSRCGMLNGTDGTWFHPMISPTETLYIFNAEVNRSLSLENSGDSLVQGLSSYRFTAARGLLNAPTFDSNNECFCVSNDTALSENGFCSLDGVLDISKCHNGVPLVLSLPHFLYSDPLLIHSSKGINPDVSKHQSYLDVEPLTGIVLSARRRIQLNIRLRFAYNLGGISLNDMVYPLVWLEEGADITKAKADELYEKIFHKIIMAQIISVSLVIAGIGLIIFSLASLSWPYVSKKFITKCKSKVAKDRKSGYTYLGLKTSPPEVVCEEKIEKT